MTAPLHKAKTRPGVDFDLLPGLIGFHLRFAYQAMLDAFARDLAAFSLTTTQFSTLTLVGANAGITQTALSKAVGIERSSAMAIIDQMEARDLLRRRPIDRRSNGLYLTAAGADLLARIKPRVQAHDAGFAEGLDSGETAALIDMLDRLSGFGRDGA